MKPDDVLAELADAPPPELPALGAELEAELADLAPTGTRNPMRQLLLLLGVSLVYGGALLVILSLRDDMEDLPMGWLAGAALGWLFGFIVPSYLAVMPRKGRVMPRWKLAAIAALIASIGFVMLGLFIHPMGKSTVSYGWDRFGHGHTCLEIGLATALVPVVIGAIFLRGALPVGSRWVAAGLGAGGGCLGGLVLHLHCHVGDALHVGVIHGGVVIVAALLSAAIVPRATNS